LLTPANVGGATRLARELEDVADVDIDPLFTSNEPGPQMEAPARESLRD
jgi:hypothetical protein